MNLLKYNLHLLLFNKYKKLINHLILITFIFLINESVYAYCVDETTLPLIAEPKVPPVKGIQTITPFQQEIAEFLETVKTITSQEKMIRQQTEVINILTIQNIEANHSSLALLIENTNIKLSSTITEQQLRDQVNLKEIEIHDLQERLNELNHYQQPEFHMLNLVTYFTIIAVSLYLCTELELFDIQLGNFF